ncbi:unnamed protein product [Bubo scandiacus]
MKSSNNISYAQGSYGCSTGDYNTENMSERELWLADLVSEAYRSQKRGQVAKEKETLSIVPSSGPTTVPSLACLYKLKGPQEGKCTRAHYPSSTVSLSASS